MIRFRYLSVFILLSILFSCQRDDEWSGHKDDKLTLRNAKEFFEVYLKTADVQTRSEDGKVTLYPGSVIPGWNFGQMSKDRSFEYAFIPFTGEHRFVAKIVSGGEVAGVEAYQVLGIVKLGDDEWRNAYVLTIIPSSEFAAANDEYCGEQFLEEMAKGVSEFEGTIIFSDYATMYPVRISRFEQGRQTGTFNGMTVKSEEELDAGVAQFMEGITLYKGKTTRAVGYDPDTGDWNLGEIEEIVVIGRRKYPSITDDSDLADDYKFWNNNDLYTDFGGLGGSTPQITEILFKSTLNEDQKKEVKRMMDSINKDCLGQAMIAALNNKTATNKLTLNYDPTADYSTFGGRGTLTLRSLTDVAGFFHEMFHAHQAYYETPDSWDTSTGNLEVECHIATINYIKRSAGNDPAALKNIDDFINRNPNYDFANDLSKFLNSKGEYMGKPGMNTADALANYTINFWGLVGFLRDKNGANSYPVDPNRSMTQNLKNLTKLAKNCL